ncbi:MAG: glycosyltransferase family 4 protein, partial [Patescibacteria group bacterium]
PRREVVTIHNGIDPYMSLLEREEARIKLFEIAAHRGSHNSQDTFLRIPFLVGVVANFYPTKGLKYLIDALAHVRTDMLTVIIGDGQLHVDLAHQIKDLGLENKIILAGRVKNAHRYLKAFDALVLPSVKEGFPWILLEAMAAKVPVIATRVGAVPELIESGRNGLIVPPANVPGLANAIEYLANDERVRDQMALEAHQDILRNFDIHQMVERYERLLNA